MANRKKTARTTPDEAKRIALEALREGHTVSEAMAKAGKSEKMHGHYRKSDPDYAAQVDVVLAQRDTRRAPAPKDISFEDWREKYLGQRTFWHQLQWVDILEGREPRDLHPAQIFEPGSKTRVLINVPPHHSKTTTLTIDFVTYRICMDPNVRIKLVSQTQGMAREFVYAIKQRLTHPRYVELQKAYAPEGGWKASAEMWRTDVVYLGGDERNSGEKDPTLQALGIGGHIYGARSNLIILDDCITGKNAHEWEKQMSWLRREVSSRLGRTGKLLIVGTRIASVDLYREIRNPEHYSGGKSPWTYFAQPAVLESADDPKDWKTLWPVSNAPIEEGSDEEAATADGMYAAWDGPALAEVRAANSPSEWAMVYQQQDVPDEAVFPSHAVKGSVNGQRKVGPLYPGAVGHRRNGMEGLYVLGSMDPAIVGDTGALVYAVDRETRMRYVLQAEKMVAPTPAKIRNLIHAWTEEFGIVEWRIEKNAFQGFLTQDEELRSWLATRGVRLSEHFTGASKIDSNFGVASVAPLFGTWQRGATNNWEPVSDPLIELPSTYLSEGTKALVEQLVTWYPTAHATKAPKQDLVMALWMAEIRAREIVNTGHLFGKSHLKNRYASGRQRFNQTVVPLSEWARSRELA